jgi:flagellar export protein FliJ
MKNFRFRLQSVLEQRERRETLAKQTLAESQASLGRAERLLGEMREVRQALLDELCRRRAGAFDAFETRMYQDYMQVILQSIGEQEGYVRELTTSCAAHKLHLLGTARDRQALAHVRDRHQQAHAHQVRRAEQGALDEMATSRFNFRGRGGEG